MNNIQLATHSNWPSSTTPGGGTTPSNNSTNSTLSTGSALIGNGSVAPSSSNSWYEAMARAWGSALNQQAQVIENLSNQVDSSGGDQPSQITQLTAESLRFSYLATSAQSSTTAVGQGLETLGRKSD